MKRVISAAALAVMAISGGAQAAIVNGGFETGDFSGWTQVGPSALFSTEASYAGTTQEYLPVEGSAFAVLSAGAGEGVYTILRQEFTVAEAGLRLVGSVAFDTIDYFYDDGLFAFNDDAYVKISSLSDATTLFFADALSVGSTSSAVGGGTPWTTLDYLFSAAGTYVFEAAVRNTGDNQFDSRLLVDGVAVVPLPAALPLLASAVMGLGGFGWVRRRRQAA